MCFPDDYHAFQTWEEFPTAESRAMEERREGGGGEQEQCCGGRVLSSRFGVLELERCRNKCVVTFGNGRLELTGSWNGKSFENHLS